MVSTAFFLFSVVCRVVTSDVVPRLGGGLAARCKGRRADAHDGVCSRSMLLVVLGSIDHTILFGELPGSPSLLAPQSLKARYMELHGRLPS